MAVITHRTRLRGGGGRSQTCVRRRDHPRAIRSDFFFWEKFLEGVSGQLRPTTSARSHVQSEKQIAAIMHQLRAWALFGGVLVAFASGQTPVADENTLLRSTRSSMKSSANLTACVHEAQYLSALEKLDELSVELKAVKQERDQISAELHSCASSHTENFYLNGVVYLTMNMSGPPPEVLPARPLTTSLNLFVSPRTRVAHQVDAISTQLQIWSSHAFDLSHRGTYFACAVRRNIVVNTPDRH